MSFEEQDQEHYATMSTLYNWRLGKINKERRKWYKIFIGNGQ